MASSFVSGWRRWLAQSSESRQRAALPVWVQLRAPWCTASERWRTRVLETPRILKLREKFHFIEWNRDAGPELDAAAQSLVQGMGLEGGWPLNLILLPAKSKTPFRPLVACGALELESLESFLRQLLVAWESDPRSLERAAQEAFEAHRARDPACADLGPSSDPSIRPLREEKLGAFLTPLTQSLDAEAGRFGRPEDAFLYPAAYQTLLRRKETLRAGHQALEALCRSSSYDVLAGGFFRSADAGKLLVENAEMLQLLQLAAKITRSPFLAHVRDEQRAHLIRDFWSTENNDFFSAIAEDREAYLFRDADLFEALNGPERAPAQKFFGLRADSRSDGSVPRLTSDIEKLSKDVGLPAADLQNQMGVIQRKLREHRDHRPLAPARLPADLAATAAALSALLADEDVLAQENPRLRKAWFELLSHLSEEIPSFAEGLAFRNESGGNRARWHLARACLTAARLRKNWPESSLSAAEWRQRADFLLGRLEDDETGVRSQTGVVGLRWDLCDLTGPSSAALRLEAWMDRLELAESLKLPAEIPLALRIRSLLPSQIGRLLEGARPLGLAASALYAAFVRGGAVGLYVSDSQALPGSSEAGTNVSIAPAAFDPVALTLLGASADRAKVNIEIVFPIAFLGTGALSLFVGRRFQDFIAHRGHSDLNPEHRERAESLGLRFHQRTRVSLVLMAVGTLWLAQALLERWLLGPA